MRRGVTGGGEFKKQFVEIPEMESLDNVLFIGSSLISAAHSE
jgi:hypothetical protein